MKRDSQSKTRRRAKMAERKARKAWGPNARTWEVTIRLDGTGRLIVDQRCVEPSEAAKLAIWENRGFILEHLSVDRVRVEVRHPHYGVVEKGVYEIPAEDWLKIPVIGDDDKKARPRPAGVDREIRQRVLDLLITRRERILEGQMKDEIDIKLGRKADPKFETDDLDGLPEFAFGAGDAK